jgi:transcriptional regulator with XRE-family HTH domain
MDVGVKIKAYMDEIGMSQIELSKKSNIPPAKLNLTLNSKRRMTFDEYQVICYVLGVGVDAFMAPRPPEGMSA